MIFSLRNAEQRFMIETLTVFESLNFVFALCVRKSTKQIGSLLFSIDCLEQVSARTDLILQNEHKYVRSMKEQYSEVYPFLILHFN